ncbi:MAG: DUF1667 domain-containing protein [Ruminococcaceae bacterium]|jgi:CxxC motif-containing protein|nr:DUF1667 domain-containing protein [Oscillospiraceae bacterium]MBQ3954275.1 DUF1667 domain-containing protein [Clostridia bacterium]
MTTRELTCVVCPAGCRMTVTLDEGGAVLSVEGNTCKRGKDYAISEITHPVRTLTSTVPLTTAEGEKMLPVRTDKAIPKEKLFEAMAIIRKSKASAPVHTGDVLIPDFIEPGTNLVACKDFA